MPIVCPSCATSYHVEPSSLGAAGRSARCVRCRTIWFARNPGALTAITRDFRAEAQALTAAGEQLAPPVSPSVTGAVPEAPLLAADVNWADQARAEQASAEQIWADHASDDQTSREQASADRISAGQAWTEQVSDAAADELVPPAATEWLAAAADPSPGGPAPVLEGLATALPLRADSAQAGDVESIAARRATRAAASRRAWALPGLPGAILVLVALNAALIGWRADVVRYLPQTASLYAAIGLPVNLRGVAFSDVATTTETQDGVPVLVVAGTILSAKDRAVEVPRLRFSIRNQSGQEVYAWTALPSRSVLAPGESVAFRSRLASPPSDTHDVLVRFFNRRDRVAGVQ